ncbi:unnamed protein product, partial [Mesorhabditis spiculigera]
MSSFLKGLFGKKDKHRNHYEDKENDDDLDRTAQRQQFNGRRGAPDRRSARWDDLSPLNRSRHTEFDYGPAPVSAMSRAHDRHSQRERRGRRHEEARVSMQARLLSSDDEEPYPTPEKMAQLIKTNRRLEERLVEYKTRLRQKNTNEAVLTEKIQSLEHQVRNLKKENRRLEQEGQLGQYRNLPMNVSHQPHPLIYGGRLRDENTPSTSALESITGESMTSQSDYPVSLAHSHPFHDAVNRQTRISNFPTSPMGHAEPHFAQPPYAPTGAMLGNAFTNINGNNTPMFTPTTHDHGHNITLGNEETPERNLFSEETDEMKLFRLTPSHRAKSLETAPPGFEQPRDGQGTGAHDLSNVAPNEILDDGYSTASTSKTVVPAELPQTPRRRRSLSTGNLTPLAPTM